MPDYKNLFLAIGKSDEEVSQRIHATFQTMFFHEKEKIYFEKGHQEGYLLDTGNKDARTEGISYGMMMALQLDQQDIFDRLWTFAFNHMLMTQGPNQGYFAWSVDTDGKKNEEGPAPDGEEYFALALFFAEARWGGREAPYDYDQQAREILHHCLHQHELVDGGHTMWDLDNHLIKFVPQVAYTDPSYHLPHFYELFAQRANEEDRPFWKKAALASVDFLRSAPHALTGMTAEYSDYDGRPRRVFREEEFYSDAYRVAMNMGLDAQWFHRKGYGDSVTKLQAFFQDLSPEAYSSYLVDGTDVGEQALHPVAIIATNAAGSLAVSLEKPIGDEERYWLEKFWNTPLRKGERRYYDNCLYLFCLLMLAGEYKIY